MKEIQLTQGKVVLVDDEDFDWLSKSNWHYSKGYAVRTSTKESGKQRTILMHREIIKTPDGMETDHINGNGIDNRRENLRICTGSENRRNKKRNRKNISGYKGVCFYKRDKNWRVQIDVRKQHIFLGYFDTAEEAARVYDDAAKKYHGEFANLNIDDKGH